MYYIYEYNNRYTIKVSCKAELIERSREREKDGEIRIQDEYNSSFFF